MSADCELLDAALTQRSVALADVWRRAIAHSNYVPLSADELRSAFVSISIDVIDGVRGDVDTAERGRRVGGALVGIGYVSAAALGTSLEVVAAELEALESTDGSRPARPRLLALLNGIAAGFTAASRERLLDEQEASRQAVLEENRRAGEAIRRQAALLDLAPDAILVRDLNGTILFWNRGAEALYGWSRTEAVGKVVHELLQTQFPVPRQTLEAGVLQLGRWEGELVHTCRDGSVITVSSRWAHQVGADVQTQTFLEINTDITARKQMEAALREREASLEVAQSIAHLGSWQFNVRTNATQWSPEAYHLLGYQEGEVRPSLNAYLDAVDPDDLPLVQRAVQDAIDGHQDSFEFRTRQRSGGSRILQSQSDCVTDSSGRPEVLFGTILDITERKRAEAERMQLLTEQAARLEAEAAQKRLAFLAWASARLASSLDYETTLHTVAQIAVPILADACTVDVLLDNGEISRVAEASSNDLSIVDLERYYSPAAKPEPVGTVLRTAETILYHDLTELTDGLDPGGLAGLKTISVSSMVVSPLAARGTLLGAITWFALESRDAYTEVERRLAQDLALRCGLALDNAKLHAEAQRATGLRDEFLSVAAHELKTPMTTLRGYTQLLGKSVAAGHTPAARVLERSVKAIEVQSEKLVKLTEQLLDVSRLEAGKLRINPVAVELVELIRGIIVSVQQSSDRHSITLSAPEACVINGDPMRLEQAVANLVGNAVKYSPDGGPVEVTLTQCESAHVEIRIRDWGLGIPPDRRQNLFDRFYQAHGEGYFGGLGLGLYVSRQIIELHGGTIDAQFPDNGGSVFVVRLPRDDQPRV